MIKHKKVNKESREQKQVKVVIYREEFYPFYYIENLEDQETEGHGYVIEMPKDNYDEVMMFQNAFIALQRQMGTFYDAQDEAYEKHKNDPKRKGKRKTCKCKKHCK